MARIKGKTIMKGVSGMVGRQVVFRTVRGETVVSGRPTKRKRISKNQEPAVENFTIAQRYAKMMMKNPEMKALYQKGITPKKTSAHAVAAYDYFHPPIIHYIKAPDYSGAIDTVITVKATDDFRVASVDVCIINGNGIMLEKGAATLYRLKPFIWKYKTTVMNTAVSGTVVNVTAKDYAQNKVEGNVEC